MFEEDKLDILIMKYRTTKDTLKKMFSPDSISQVVAELRLLENLSEGRNLDYIQNKISQGIELSESEMNELVSTVCLHQNAVVLTEEGEISFAHTTDFIL